MGDTGIDWWHVGAIVVVALISVTDILVPAMMIHPLATAGEKLADGSLTAKDLTSALPSMAWPTVALALGLLVMGTATWRMYVESQVEGRWLWVLAVAAMTVLWSVMIMGALGRAEVQIVHMAAGL